MKLKLAVPVVCALGAFALIPNARADFISGYGWITTDAIASSGTAATAASLALATCSHGNAACTTADADVSFTTTGISFTPPGLSSGTILQWLNSSSFPLDNLVDSVPSSPLSPSIWEFMGNTIVTGTPSSPQNFTFQHDDGMVFIVNGQTVVDAPGPTGPVVTTGHYTGGASDSAPFVLYYAECCGGAAVLTTNLVGPGTAPPGTTVPPSSVPEPASLGLAAAGLGLIFLRRRHA